MDEDLVLKMTATRVPLESWMKILGEILVQLYVTDF